MARGKLGLAPKGHKKSVYRLKRDCVCVCVCRSECQVKSPRGHQVHRCRQQQSLPVSSRFGLLEHETRKTHQGEMEGCNITLRKEDLSPLYLQYLTFNTFKFCSDKFWLCVRKHGRGRARTHARTYVRTLNRGIQWQPYGGI